MSENVCVMRDYYVLYKVCVRLYYRSGNRRKRTQQKAMSVYDCNNNDDDEKT